MDDIFKGRLIWAALFIGVCTFLYMVQDALGPFLFGLGLAYVFHPLIDRCEARLVPRWLSSFILVVVTLALFAAFWFLLLPFLGFQLQKLFYKLPLYTKEALDFVRPKIATILEKIHTDPVLKQSELMVPKALQKAFVWGTDQVLFLLSNAQGITRFLFYTCVTPFVMFYGLLEWPTIVAKVKNLIPHSVRPRWMVFFTRLDQSLSGYIRGQLLVCLCMGTYLAIAFVMMGLPHGLMLGALTGALIFIPYLGMTLGTLLAVILTLVNTPSLTTLIVLMIALIGGQLLEGFIFIPFFIGKRVGLHPVWVLFAIFALGTLFGFWGVLLALPMATFVYALLREGLAFYQSTAFFQKAPAKS